MVLHMMIMMMIIMRMVINDDVDGMMVINDDADVDGSEDGGGGSDDDDDDSVTFLHMEEASLKRTSKWHAVPRHTGLEFIPEKEYRLYSGDTHT